MKKLWHDDAWDDYLCWQTEDKKTLGNLSGYWSVRIDEKNRIVFRIENGSLEIAERGSHYGDH